MPSTWFYEKDGQRLGPVDDAAMKSLLNAGDIKDTTPVIRAGTNNWTTPRALRNAKAARKQSSMPPLRGFDRSGPWRRFFARGMDTLACAVVLFATLGLIDLVLGSDLLLAVREANLIIVNLAIAPIACVVNAVSLSVFGNTVGKWAYGLRVIPASGAGQVSPDAYFRREFDVWMKGLWFYAPLLWIVPAVMAGNAVEKGRPTAYDAGRFEVVSEREGSIIPIAITLAVALLYMVVHKPPSRVYSEDLGGVQSSE